MASMVKEIMNRELFSVRSTDTAADALDGLLAFGIYGAPVLDSGQRPIGVISLRDLVTRQGTRVTDHMSSPAVVVRADARISDAARLIAETGYRRLVVIDDDRRAVGMLSAVDVIRGLVGLPVQHPGAFRHFRRRHRPSMVRRRSARHKHGGGGPRRPWIAGPHSRHPRNAGFGRVGRVHEQRSNATPRPLVASAGQC